MKLKAQKFQKHRNDERSNECQNNVDFKYLMEADLGESPTNLRKAPIFFLQLNRKF